MLTCFERIHPLVMTLKLNSHLQQLHLLKHPVTKGATPL